MTELPDTEALREAIKNMNNRFDCPALWSLDWNSILYCANQYVALLDKLGKDRVLGLLTGERVDVRGDLGGPTNDDTTLQEGIDYLDKVNQTQHGNHTGLSLIWLIAKDYRRMLSADKGDK